jgi:hypothetical protein
MLNYFGVCFDTEGFRYCVGWSLQRECYRRAMIAFEQRLLTTYSIGNRQRRAFLLAG